MKRAVIAVAATAMLFGAMGSGVQAASHKHSDPPCSVSPNPATVGETYVVSASGLPTTVVLNFWTIAPDGTMTGVPLGTDASGALSYSTSASSAGTWNYEVTGTNIQQVYSSCSVQVN